MDYQQVQLVVFVVCFSNLLEDSKSDQNLQKPTHFAVIFDSARKTFRNDIYSDYKANRSEAPDDLAPQFKYITKICSGF